MPLKDQNGNERAPETLTTPGSVSSVPPTPESATQWRLFPPEDSSDGLGQDLRIFRPIHYLGSKLRMVDAIVDAVDKVDPSSGRVYDLFAGSGTVAGVLARTRSVTAVDIQEYSRVLCSAVVHPMAVNGSQHLNLEPADTSSLAYATASIVHHEQESIDYALSGYPEMLNDFLEHCSLIRFLSGEFHGSQALRDALAQTALRLKEVGLDNSSSSLTTRMFGGVYFSYSQAVQLDGLLDAAFSNPLPRRDLMLAAVLSTASEIVNTIGKQFAQPLRPKDKHGATKRNLLDKIQKDRSANVRATFHKWLQRYQAVSRTPRPHRVVRSDYVEALTTVEEDTTVVYADPPYTRDHYSRYYHVLETMSLRDNPSVAKVRIGGVERISRGVYRVHRHQSPFCIPSKASQAFSTLLAGVARRGLPLVLSYSPYRQGSDARPRLLTVEEITSLAETEFSSVKVEQVGQFFHNKLNNARLNKARTQFAESLIICRP